MIKIGEIPIAYAVGIFFAYIGALLQWFGKDFEIALAKAEAFCYNGGEKRR